MRVIVDTPVWSLGVRRRRRPADARESDALAEWKALVGEGNAVMCGPVRQEVLSGLSDESHFESLRARLRWFPDEPLFAEDFEEAGRAWTSLQRAGITVSTTDALLCALAIRLRAPVFSTDRDFAQSARVLPIRLHAPR